ncbi:uncharacterized protein LOC141661694 isoform X1 [Apium graveolens]|uniref:uncharacterized protein LOC141661694 isoform X1 n=1 Tax=Apium graveolens TaxID=4045 RepID=UPI003D7C0A0D
MPSQKSSTFLYISHHWSLVIICIRDKEDEFGPILLHLDSVGFTLVVQFLKILKGTQVLLMYLVIGYINPAIEEEDKDEETKDESSVQEGAHSAKVDDIDIKDESSVQEGADSAKVDDIDIKDEL